MRYLPGPCGKTQSHDNWALSLTKKRRFKSAVSVESKKKAARQHQSRPRAISNQAGSNPGAELISVGL
jgi:hypothetical protein